MGSALLSLSALRPQQTKYAGTRGWFAAVHAFLPSVPNATVSAPIVSDLTLASTSQRGARCELGAVSSSNPTRPMTTTCRSLSQLLPNAGMIHLPGLKTVKAVLGPVPTGMPATNHAHVIKSSEPHYTKRALQTVTYGRDDSVDHPSWSWLTATVVLNL